MVLQFEKLEIKHIERIRPVFESCGIRTCDYTVGGTFLWRGYFGTQVCFAADCVIFRSIDVDGACAYSCPVGGDVCAALTLLEQHCAAAGEKLVFSLVPEQMLPVIQQKFPDAHVQPERDWFDYLYEKESYVNLGGRHLSGQRNHISRFKREYPSWHCEKLSCDNTAAIAQFYTELAAKTGKDSQLYAAESKLTVEAVQNPCLYGLDGCVLYADERIAGFAIGETVGDTVHIHIEKADVSYQGVYAMLAQQYAMITASDAVKYYNREDDAGDEGLRRAKLSYRPCALLEKYTVTV